MHTEPVLKIKIVDPVWNHTEQIMVAATILRIGDFMNTMYLLCVYVIC